MHGFAGPAGPEDTRSSSSDDSPVHNDMGRTCTHRFIRPVAICSSSIPVWKSWRNTGRARCAAVAVDSIAPASHVASWANYGASRMGDDDSDCFQYIVLRHHVWFRVPIQQEGSCLAHKNKAAPSRSSADRGRSCSSSAGRSARAQWLFYSWGPEAPDVTGRPRQCVMRAVVIVRAGHHDAERGAAPVHAGQPVRARRAVCAFVVVRADGTRAGLRRSPGSSPPRTRAGASPARWRRIASTRLRRRSVSCHRRIVYPLGVVIDAGGVPELVPEAPPSTEEFEEGSGSESEVDE